jgi:hypothetical protein
MNAAQARAIQMQEAERMDGARQRAVRGALRHARDVEHDLMKRSHGFAAIYKALGATILGEVNCVDMVLTQDEQFRLVELGLEEVAGFDTTRDALESALNRAGRLIDGDAQPEAGEGDGHELA